MAGERRGDRHRQECVEAPLDLECVKAHRCRNLGVALPLEPAIIQLTLGVRLLDRGHDRLRGHPHGSGQEATLVSQIDDLDRDSLWAVEIDR